MRLPVPGPGMIRVLFLSWALLLVAAPARAASTLTQLRVFPTQDGGARVVLLFAGTAPPYRAIGDGTKDVTLQFVQTARAATLPAMIPGTGPLLRVDILNAGPSIALVLHLTQPVPLRIVANGSTLTIDIPPGSALTPPSPYAQRQAPLTPQNVEIVPLKYADVSEIVGVLVAGQSIAPNDVFRPEATNFGQSTYGGLGFQQPSVTTPTMGTYVPGAAEAGGLGQRINDHVAIDRRLNAIILSGTPDEIAAMKFIIEKLDVPLTSVMLETQVVELTETASKEIGIDYTGSGGAIGTATFTAQSLQTAQGVLKLQAAIFAQIASGRGRVISSPRILALNGQPASILTGDELPIITSIALSGTSAVQQQVQYINVGVNLQILPRIAGDGYVTTHIFSQVSNVTAFTQGVPQISQRQATTTVTVADGQPFIIGGLLQQSELRNMSKIPILGNLPILGQLFRLENDTKQTTNLYLIVTPHVLRREP